ncbi:MAG: hypothetical protein SXA11_11670 [Cyanobacteriota bacterium]|nr:hypothetical protein [Cyanobacteriota bacterium]
MILSRHHFLRKAKPLGFRPTVGSLRGNRQDACFRATGKMPVLGQQARCLFYGNR